VKSPADGWICPLRPPLVLAPAAFTFQHGSLVGPLVGELTAQRQTNERLNETIRDQAGTIGSLTQEVATLRASQAKQDANPGPVASKTARAGCPGGRLEALASFGVVAARRGDPVGSRRGWLAAVSGDR
jgi:hypothetical protein